MFCKNCGAEVQNGADFCPVCGNEIVKKTKANKRKRSLAIIACVCCMAIIVSGIVGGLHFYNNSEPIDSSDSNYIAFQEGFTDVIVTDEESALEAVSSVAGIIGAESVEEELKIDEANIVDDNTYYRFQQYCNGIPVYGKSICLTADKDGYVMGLTSNYTVFENSSAVAKATTDDINKSVQKYFDDNIVIDSIGNDELVYYIDDGDTPVLAYLIEENNSKELLLVNASNAEVIKTVPKYFSKSAESCIYNGENTIGIKTDFDKYIVGDCDRNIYIFCADKDDNGDYKACLTESYEDITDDSSPLESDNNVFGDEYDNHSNGDFGKGIKLLQYLQVAADFYKSINSNQDTSILGVLNQSFDPVNAFGGYGELRAVTTYNLSHEAERLNVLLLGTDICSDMESYIDTIGHELSHGITGSNLNWDYDGNCDSGALSEAYSDIFGELIEEEISGETDWIHGDRNAVNPHSEQDNKYPYPETMTDVENAAANDNYYFIDEATQTDYAHFASNVIFRSAYLMWNGIDGDSNKKIDSNNLAKIWYNSLFLMQSDPSFSQCRNAVELSARLMVKNGELTAEQYNCVCEAFDNVGIDNAGYSYEYTVKNDFDLKVLNGQNASVNFKLKIYKRVYFFGLLKRLVLEENSVSGSKKINLDDGVYILEIEDLASDNTTSKPIGIKIIVDGDGKNATDEVTVHTDFLDTTTIVLNEEKDDDVSAIPGTYIFSSGAGGWRTELNINEDFTFSANYIYSNYEGNFICGWSGAFLSPEKTDDYTYKLTVESVALDHEEGYVYYDNDVKYVCIGEAYGFDDCTEFYLYLEDRSTSDLSEEFLSWIYDYDENSEKLPCICIRNPDREYAFVKSEADEEDTEEAAYEYEETENTTEEETSTDSNGQFYGNETAEQLRKSIIGSWGELGSIVPEYNFIDSENCTGDMPWQSEGTYSISDDKTLTISWAGKAEQDIYIWSSESWDEFYSHHDYGTDFWCITDDDILMLNSKEKYRDPSDTVVLEAGTSFALCEMFLK